MGFFLFESTSELSIVTKATLQQNKLADELNIGVPTIFSSKLMFLTIPVNYN